VRGSGGGLGREDRHALIGRSHRWLGNALEMEPRPANVRRFHVTSTKISCSGVVAQGPAKVGEWRAAGGLHSSGTWNVPKDHSGALGVDSLIIHLLTGDTALECSVPVTHFADPFKVGGKTAC
jgi:hypothetical protein